MSSNLARAPQYSSGGDRPPHDGAPSRRACRSHRRRAPAHRSRDCGLHGAEPAPARQALRPRPRLHGPGRARGGPQRPRADRDAPRPATGGPGVLPGRLAAPGDPARPDPRRAADAAGPRRGDARPRQRLGQDPAARRGLPRRPDPGRHPDALLPDRHGHRAVRGDGLQRPPEGRRRARRDGRRRDDRVPDPAPGTRPLRLLQDVGARAGRAADRWQKFLVRHLRRISFAPVGANNAEQKADFGDLLGALGIDDDLESFALQISRVERELFWAQKQGMRVPDYVLVAFREAVELARAAPR